MKGIGKLKSNRGVTLTSLVIYIIGLTIVIALMGIISNYFYQNITDVTIKQNADEQYSKFLAYLTKDANSDNLIYVQSGVQNVDCVIFKFSDGTEHQYITKDEKMYYINSQSDKNEKILLCEKVTTSSENVFNYTDKTLNINLDIDNQNFTTTLSVNM